MTIEEELKNWNRIYTIHDLGGDIHYKCPQKACVFCKHCTGVFWDADGIYMIICDIDEDIESGWIGHCEQFKEKEEYETD